LGEPFFGGDQRACAAFFLRLSMPSVLAGFAEAGRDNPTPMEMTVTVLSGFFLPEGYRGRFDGLCFPELLDNHTLILETFLLLPADMQLELSRYFLFSADLAPGRCPAPDLPKISIDQLRDAISAVTPAIPGDFFPSLRRELASILFEVRGDSLSSIEYEMYLFNQTGCVSVVPMLLDSKVPQVVCLTRIEQEINPDYKWKMHQFLTDLAKGCPTLADCGLVLDLQSKMGPDVKMFLLNLCMWSIRSVIAYNDGESFARGLDDSTIVMAFVTGGVPEAPVLCQALKRYFVPFCPTGVAALREQQAAMSSPPLFVDATMGEPPADGE
jgi:hypothetical protein